mmetsp:Transcript_21154/g.44087  ORF Transcript_21154/g.44087 Transcript_21154/m.44087 type:complete len:346 (-) Transcript_21154:650-1687(-)
MGSKVDVTVRGRLWEQGIYGLSKPVELLVDDGSLINSVDHDLTVVQVIGGGFVGVEDNNAVLNDIRNLNSVGILFSLLEGVNINRVEDASSNDSVKASIFKSSLNFVGSSVVNEGKLVDGVGARVSIPVVGKVLEFYPGVNDVVGVCIILNFAEVLPPSSARKRSNPNAVHVIKAIEGDGTVSRVSGRTRVLRVRVATCTTNEGGRRKHARRTDIGELLKKRVVRIFDSHLEHIVTCAFPTLQLIGKAPPSRMPSSHWRGKDVIVVELRNGALPVLSVVKLDSLTKVECVLLLSASNVLDGPRFGKGGVERAVVAELKETLVDHVVCKELIWTVGMWVQPSDRFE